MTLTWSTEVERHLLETTLCPRCGEGELSESRCSLCGADLSGPIAEELWQRSVSAADAVRARQKVIDRVPVLSLAMAGAVAGLRAPAASALIDQTPPPPRRDLPSPVSGLTAAVSSAAVAAAERSSFTVQSVLAVAGAGLFAIAAIVFAFFNPDLTDVTTRTTVIGVVTVLFLGGAWLLARRALRFSAEAVGALGMVFVALDVYSFTALAGPDVSAWVFAAIGTLVSGTIMLVASLRARLRTWLWISVLGLASTPAMLGLAFEGGWSLLVGLVATGFAAVGLYEVVRRVGSRFGSELNADRSALTALRVLVGVVVLVQLPFVPGDSGVLRTLGIAGLVAALAALSAASTRHQLVALWSFCAGALGVGAVGIAALAIPLDQPAWYVAIAPAAAVLAVVALTAPARLGSARRPVALAGGLIMAGVALFPAANVAAIQVLGPIGTLAFDGQVRGLTWRESFFVLGDNGTFVDSAWGLAAILGLAAGALGALAMSSLVRAASALAIGAGPAFLALSVWIGGGALAALVTSTSLSRPVQLGIALLAILGIAVLVLRVRSVAGAARSVRIPLLATAHVLVVLAAVISWADANLTVAAGILLLAAFAVLARAMPVLVRPLSLGLGYAYGLALFALALDLSDVVQIAVLCLTATLAAVVALTATLTPWLRVRSWYAVLIVTFVPFLIGVVSVLPERSGWAAISTGAMAVLAFALLVTRRTGMNRPLRTAAAFLIVPSVAVVVTNLSATLLDGSGSPIALPVIAAMVALVLPSIGLIAGLLVRHGIPSPDVRWARRAIESSALVTAGLAVVLALVRSASGLPTTFLVLVILGVGALATAIWGRRVYGYWLAGASFTGALWCIWALNGVTLIEPYLLPPTLAAAIIGAILVGRGVGRALALYASGLVLAVAPVVVILGVAGSGVAGSGITASGITGIGTATDLPWRTLGLLTASAMLLVISVVTARLHTGKLRLAVLAPPTLAVAIIAAAAGMLQGMRYGWELDALPGFDPEYLMLVVLTLGAVALALAAVAARLLLTAPASPAIVRGSRWLSAPALVFLVAGPMTAIRDSPLAIWTLWGLTIATLVLLVITTARGRRGATALPPVWFIFLVAFVTAIVGWSEREILRVEGWSLPLGGFLLLAGVIAMVPPRDGRMFAPVTVTRWPIGARRSWITLAPGILVIFLASISATGTDPQTWRAILVIGIALAAIIVGSFRKLAAPFILGLIAAGLEILMVFVVQIGQRIDPVLWWITLATAGAVLLVIAVTSERRGSGDTAGSWSGRMRDLR